MNSKDQKQFLRLLDAAIQRAQVANPDYTPPPFSPENLIRLLEENMQELPPGLYWTILQKLRSALAGNQFDQRLWVEVWRTLNYIQNCQPEFFCQQNNSYLPRDKWGYEPEFLERIKPIFEFFYHYYWRVSVTGLENVPEQGRVLLVANHSGQFPFDGFMIGISLLNDHPGHRMVRGLYAKWFRSLPYLSTFLTRLGQVLANEENAIRLLEEDHMVAVFPEGYRGISKSSKERYRLARFGRGGYVRMAVRTGAPIIPISVVGAEEMYTTLVEGAWAEKFIGYPVPSITLTWPWLGLLGIVPLPTKWYIDFGQPIPVESYHPDQADNAYLVAQLNDQVRNTIQSMLHHRLAQRNNIFI